MTLRFASALCLSLCSAGAAWAAPPPADNAGTWTIQVENDAASTLKGTSDKYYTSGLRLGWTSANGNVPDFASRAANVLWGDGETRIAIDLSQSIFTPAKTQLNPPDPHDRPYAAWLRADFKLEQDQDDARGLIDISVGLIGPGALGEEVQNGFHHLIGDTPNKGWGHQLKTLPTLEILSDRVWRLPITTLGPLETDALPELTLGIGDVRDYALAGVRVRIGQGLNSDFGPARIEPGMSGSDYFTQTRPLAWYVFAGVDGQAVAYDVTLDGEPFRSGPHVSKKWAVAEFEGGVGVIWHGVRITYTQVFRTEEFHGQKGGLFNFGSLALSTKF